MGKKKRDRKENVWGHTYSASDFTNAKLEAYYKNTLSWEDDDGEAEWEAFLKCLRSPLPSCIRLSTSDPIHQARIQKMFAEAIALGEGGMRQMPIFEGSRVIAWDIDMERRKLKRSAGQLRAFHQSLVMETKMGTVSRQEAVSMLPVVFLDVQAHHTMLDMCAAPGSKTAQMIEATENTSTGVVIANDVDIKRLSVLIKQCQRLRGVAPHLLVTHCDATAFPLGGVKFDRILCDVMCSGDGTLRKSPDLWMRWSPMNGPNMHRQQIRVLQRAFRLLKPGGRVVYSTCSMNPIEDEASVAHCVTEANGQIEIVEAAAQFLPNLKYRKGKSSWRFMTNDGTWYSSFEEIPQETVQRFHIVKSMFPPLNAEKLGLERTIRVLPHQQNTGGFYIAVLQKCADALDEPEISKKDFDIFRPIEASLLEAIQKTWNLRVDFPFHLLFQRCDSKKQTKFYLTSPDALPFVRPSPQKINIQHVGVRLFEMPRRSSGDPVRLAQEGAAHVAPFLTEGIVRFTVTPEDFTSFLQRPQETRIAVLDTAVSTVFVVQTTAPCGTALCLSVHKSMRHAGFSLEIDDVEKGWMLARLGVVVLPVVPDRESDEDEEEEECQSEGNALDESKRND